MYTLAATLPGLPHRLTHGASVAEALRRLGQALPGGVLEGERVVATGDLERALSAAAEVCDGLGVAVAVAEVGAESLDGHPLGRGPHLARRTLAFAREGEVWIPPTVTRWPDGVGVFDAPAVASEQLGVAMRLLRDYR